jgi:hypothetical protein
MLVVALIISAANQDYSVRNIVITLFHLNFMLDRRGAPGAAFEHVRANCVKTIVTPIDET